MTTNPFHAYVLDPLERAVSTFVQQFVVVLMATGSAGLVAYQSWGQAADVAGFAAVVSVLTSVATFWVPKLPVGVDLLLRVVKTGLQSFLGVLAGGAFSHSLVHAGWSAALATAFPVMAAALLKGLASLALPWSDGASLLPVTPLTYAEPLDLYDDAPAAEPDQLDSVRAADPAVNGEPTTAATDPVETTPTITTPAAPQPSPEVSPAPAPAMPEPPAPEPPGAAPTA